MKKIMIIEDDEVVREELNMLLKSANYETIILKDFTKTEEFILDNKVDLLLLDINLPYKNGEEILKNIRIKDEVPVIMLTSKDNTLDEALSITYGADDYITKPYNPNILLLRIQNVLKRYNPNSIYKYHDFVINVSRCELVKDEQKIDLTKNEMIIFMLLYNKINEYVSRDEIITELWNKCEYINDNVLTVNISRLRKKLSDVGINDAIETKKGLGYMLS